MTNGWYEALAYKHNEGKEIGRAEGRATVRKELLEELCAKGYITARQAEEIALSRESYQGIQNQKEISN